MTNNNENDEKLVDNDNNSSSSGNESAGVKLRRSARLLNKASAAAAEKSKSPLKRGNEVEGSSSRNSRQKMSEAVAVETTDNTEGAESTESDESVRSADTTQTAGITQTTRTTGTNATSSATTTSPMPSAPQPTQTTQSNRRSASTSPPLFSISIGFGPMPPSFASSAHFISSGSQQDLPPEIQQMIENMTGGMRNSGVGSSRPATSTTTTSFRSMGDGIGIGIAGISIPISVLNGTGSTPTNNDFLELARQMSQIISRVRSSTPTSEDFANISDDLEPLLNDFFSRIFGGPASSAPSGLSSERIALLPETSSKSEIDCSICREVGSVGEEKCVELPCKHSFHFECIEPWLKRVASCPICRKVIE